jgi:ribosome maturation factor RimP
VAANEVHIREIAAEKSSAAGCFLVEVRIKPSKLFITVDKMEGITISECASISRQVEAALEGSGILETHDLEVSSPGLDQPLKVMDQFIKYIGKKVLVKTTDRRERIAILKNAGSEAIEIEEKIKSKVNGLRTEENLSTLLPMNLIMEVKPVISFKS